MVQIAELAADPATVEASLFYLARGADKLVTYVAAPGGRDERTGGGSETHRVTIHNGRPLADHFVFEREDSALRITRAGSPISSTMPRSGGSTTRNARR